MRCRPETFAALLAIALACAIASLPPAASATAERIATRPAALTPYKARYQVSYRGLGGGQIENSLRPADRDDLWLYETRAYPNLFGRVAVSPQARERGTMQISNSGVRPLTFAFDDGSDDSSKDVRLEFDWAAGLVRGSAEHGPIEMAVTPGTQDTASVQAAMIVELLAGREPRGFRIMTGGKLRDYRYWPEGHATVVTPYGQFDAVVWASQRDGSTRVTRVWHAPSLGYLPVQAVQYRKGQPEFQMRLVALER
jgi:hypothetical protein